jgi:cysteinyl-tRNA synthetase
VLEKYDPETLRFFILSAHYRSPIDFSDQNLDDALTGLERIYTCLAAMDVILNATPASNELPSLESLPEAGLELRDKIDQAIPRFVEAMDDDFNSALALGVLFEIIRATNRFLAETKDVGPVAMMLLAQVRHLFVETGEVLGLFGSRPSHWLEGIKSAKADQIDISPEKIEQLIIERSEARKARNFKRGDEIRDMLLEMGIQLLDSAQGTTWNVK